MASVAYTLRSGRVITANDGIIGLSPDLVLKEGYDGSLEWEDMDEPFTESERLEIASLMIARFTEWAILPWRWPK